MDFPLNIKKILDLIPEYNISTDHSLYFLPYLQAHKGTFISSRLKDITVEYDKTTQKASAGIRIGLLLDPGSHYELHLKAYLRQGDKAFIYCEDIENNRLIPRTHFITADTHNQIFMIQFTALCKKNWIGILFHDFNQNYSLIIEKFVVREIPQLNTLSPQGPIITHLLPQNSSLLQAFPVLPKEPSAAADKSLWALERIRQDHVLYTVGKSIQHSAVPTKDLMAPFAQSNEAPRLTDIIITFAITSSSQLETSRKALLSYKTPIGRTILHIPYDIEILPYWISEIKHIELNRCPNYGNLTPVLGLLPILDSVKWIFAYLNPSSFEQDLESFIPYFSSGRPIKSFKTNEIGYLNYQKNTILIPSSFIGTDIYQITQSGMHNRAPALDLLLIYLSITGKHLHEDIKIPEASNNMIKETKQKIIISGIWKKYASSLMQQLLPVKEEHTQQASRLVPLSAQQVSAKQLPGQQKSVHKEQEQEQQLQLQKQQKQQHEQQQQTALHQLSQGTPQKQQPAQKSQEPKYIALLRAPAPRPAPPQHLAIPKALPDAPEVGTDSEILESIRKLNENQNPIHASNEDIDRMMQRIHNNEITPQAVLNFELPPVSLDFRTTPIMAELMTPPKPAVDEPDNDPNASSSGYSNMNDKHNIFSVIIPEPEIRRSGRRGSESKVAVIVEPRDDPRMIRTIAHFLRKLDRSWAIQVFHGNKNEKMLRESILAPFIENQEIYLSHLRLDNLTKRSYSNLLLTERFYNRCKGDHILIFQMDTYLCDYPKESIDSFLVYDYVGAPWPNMKSLLSHNRKVVVGNGGLSLRKRSTMLAICRLLKQKRFNRFLQHNEDLVIASFLVSPFFKGPQSHHKVKLPTQAEAALFSVEMIYQPGALGGHRPWSYHGRNILERIAKECHDFKYLFGDVI